MAHGLAMAGGAVRATDDMAYPAGLPGSLRLEPRELHQLGHPADRTLAPESVRWRTNVTCSTDRYGATFVVALSLGPPDCQATDFTDIQAAINALPPAGGKIFVKAGTYVVSLTIRIEQSNVHIQGEGMGITNIVTVDTMTASPAIQVYNPNAGNALPLLTDTSMG